MSGLMRVKLWRDLRATWSRLLLMVIAIAVSLTVFSGVLFTWSTSARETSRAYLGTEPASATIRLDRPIAVDRMAAIATAVRTQPGVIEASGRTQFTSRVEVNGRLRSNPLQVFVAPPEPLRIARFEMEQGTWPPDPESIFIGRDSLTLLEIAVGDSVVIELPGGRTARVRVAGIVYDPSLAPAPQEQTGHAYLSWAALAMGGGQALVDQLKIQVAAPGQSTTPSRDRTAIVAVASDVGTWLTREYGIAIREIQVPEPYAHPHQGQADALLLSLLFGGGVALLLSTLLVANMLNGLFTRQIPQIGILKAIGARSARIAGLYLAMTLIVAGTATAVALPLGILLGRAAVPAILGFLGIESDSLAASWWTYVVVLTAGLVLPPLMAAVPLVRTSRTTVRAAMDHHGLGAAPGPAATGVLAQLGRIRGLDRGLLMALRNTIRRPARFLLSVGLLASAGMVFVAGTSTRDGVAAIQEEAQAQRLWDVNVQLARPASMADVAALLEQLPGVERVEGFHLTETGVAGPQEIPISRTYPDQGHGRVAVMAIPAGPVRFFTVPRLREGRWLEPGESGAIVLNQVTVKNTVPGTRAGDMVELSIGGRPTTWRVVGIAEERTAGGGAYVTAEGFSAATGQPLRVNQLRIATRSHDEQTRTNVAAAARESLAAAGVEVRAADSVSRSDAITEGHLGPIILIVLALSIAMAVIGCIGLASTMSANVLERTREFGVMHAIGARPKAVRRIVVAEGVFIAIASCLVAVIPTLGLTWVMGSGLGNLFMFAPLPFRISALAAGIWIALVCLGAILATEAAATRASRLTVREALAYL